jgi:autotransporter-associated beta strand protein
LVKVGSNEIGLVDVFMDPALGDIDIQNGVLHVEGTTSSFGDPAYTLTVEPGALLGLYSASVPLNKHFVLNGDGVTAAVTNINGISTLAGPVTLTNSVIIWVNGSGLTNSGVISGGGSLTKLGGSPLVLTANETYTGNTTVRNGSMVLQGSAAISGSTNITVLAGATVDVSSRVNGTLTLNSGQTLQGYGTVSGILTAGSGSVISPGTNGVIGRLTVTGDAGLSGTLNMKLDKSNATNDVLSVGGQISYGGTLNLNSLSGTLAANDQFKLFNAGTYTGSFASVTPTHPNNDANLNWDTSSLTVNGTLKVVPAGPPPQAHITGISLSGTTLTITATNGSASGQYVLLASTNVALPLAQWTPVLTNNFDGSGNLNLSTNIVNPANAQTFYILKQ